MRVSAPSTSANLGSGFDIVAVAHDAYFAYVDVTVSTGCSINVRFARHDPGPDNTVTRSLRFLMDRLGVCRDVDVYVDNRIPIGRGLGSSGAAAAAALAGFIYETGINVDPALLITAAGIGESAAAGSPHYDNVSAALLGGAVVLLGLDPITYRRFTPRLTLIVAVPHVETPPQKTKLMRDVLPREVPFRTYVDQLARVSSLVIGLAVGDPYLVARGMVDEVVEKARMPLVPGYQRVRRYAMDSGALGVAISGAGPAMVILARDEDADTVAHAVRRAYAEEGIHAEVKVAQICEGAMSLRR